MALSTYWIELRNQRRQRQLARRARRRERVRRRSGPPLPYTSHALSLLAGSSLGDVQPDNPKKKKSAHLTLKVPPVFSLIDSPKESLQPVLDLAREARRRRPSQVEFRYDRVRELDIGAEMVLSIAAYDYLKELRRSGKAKPTFRGIYPPDHGLRRLIKSIGLIRVLDIRHEFLAYEQERLVLVFRTRRQGGYAAPSAADATFLKDAVVDFVRYVSTVLQIHNHALTPEAIQHLCNYVGEVLGNADEHAGLRDWTIAAHLDMGVKDPVCQIAIVNFGKSIAETFQALDPRSFARTQVDPYVDEHRARGYFRPGWREEDLLTLVALQGHVSSKNRTRTDTRGQGTVDLIEFFQRTHEELAAKGAPPKMSLVSGSTYILFDGKYRMTKVKDRSTIAFNAENDLNLPPDPAYIRGLGAHHLPGTAVTIRFPLPPEARGWVVPA